MNLTTIHRRHFVKMTSLGLFLGFFKTTLSHINDYPGNKIVLHKKINLVENSKILVAYASRTGSTEGIAREIARILNEDGISADVLSMTDIKDISDYSAIIAGSAIQGRQWLPEAMDFMTRNEAALSQKPFAAYLVCMTLAMNNAEKYRPEVSGWLEPVRKIKRPTSEALFAGTLYIDKIPSRGDRFKFKLSVMLGVWKEGDHRDWNAVREWAKTLTKQLVAQ